MSAFLKDVLQGLSAPEKYLQSKYFYDEKGDSLFQQIMGCPEYYPTRCEMEILTTQTAAMVNTLTTHAKTFDVVELGAGDAVKSVHLLKALLKAEVPFTYYPVDISANIINLLKTSLPNQAPRIQQVGLNGEYLSMLEQAKQLSTKTKVVLFLGGNIGNVPLDKAGAFYTEMRSHLRPGDLVVTGIDLKKSPKIILDAYNDKAGYTRDFNLNLLHRINKEFGGTFNPEQFYHFPTYDPATGACKSYLVSSADQTVAVAGQTFHFTEGEHIFMEIAQKYTAEQIEQLCKSSGFEMVTNFYDEKHWFTDTVWKCI